MPDLKNKFDEHIVIQDSLAAIDALSAQIALSKQQLKDVMQKGAVWVTRGDFTQRIRRAKKQCNAGDVLHCYYDEKIIKSKPFPAKLIADESAYSIWFKPYGMYSQGSKWGDHCTIYRWAEQHLQPQRSAYIVHRLDRAASGLIIIAHEKKVAAQFAELFRQHKIFKHYRVWVNGLFPYQAISCDESLDNKKAISHFKLLKKVSLENQSLLDVSIETGRKHQIRRHLSSMGYSIVGDRLYGNLEHTIDLQLLAYSIEFTCPISGESKQYCLDDKSFEIDA